MENEKLLECISKIYNEQVPFTWEQFLKCGLVIFGYLKRKTGGAKLYRACFIKEDDVRKNLKSRYSYPPIDITEMGRCNLKGHPVFYGSSNFLGAVQEAIIAQKNPNVLKDYNNTIYVSEWGMLETKEFYIYDTRNNLPIKLGNKEETFNSIYQNLMNKIFTSKKGHDISANLSFMLMNGTKQTGKEPDKLYPPPGMGNCKFIFYPTVARNENFINLAIHPSIIDDNIVTINKVFKINPPIIDLSLIINAKSLPFEFLQVGFLSKSDRITIEWRGPMKEDYSYI